MVNPVQQGHDNFRRGRIRHGAQRVFQLRGLDGDPENVGRWNLGCLFHGSREISKQRAVQLYLGRKSFERAGAHDHRDLLSNVCQAGAQHTANSTRTKNHVTHTGIMHRQADSCGGAPGVLNYPSRSSEKL